MVKETKLKEVETLKKNIERSAVIAIVDMYKMPSKQLQEIRKGLRGKAKIKMIKKTILKFAIDGVKKDSITTLESHIPTQPAIVFTDMEAFKFYNLVSGLKFKTFAKEGDRPDEDIWVSAGPTPLMAGPAISEFQQAGIPASIESGRIMIRKDKRVVKKGEEISSVVAGVLRKLKIEPMEVTLNVVAIYDNGSVYTKESLELTKTFPQMLSRAFNNALNLSVFIAFPTKENIKQLITKAARAANSISSMMGAPTPTVKAEEPKEKKVPEEKKGGKKEEVVNDDVKDDAKSGVKDDVNDKEADSVPKKDNKENHGGAS